MSAVTTVHEAADVMREYKREIMRAVRQCTKEAQVGVTVWKADGAVACPRFDKHSLSSAAHAGHAYVMYVSGDRWLSYNDLEEAIDTWEYEQGTVDDYHEGRLVV